jgi:hypothetical protein
MDTGNTSNQQSTVPMELDDHTKAILEALFTTRLQEQATSFRAEAQAREAAWIEQEKIYETNDASLRAVVESLSTQLMEAKLDKPK